jgi:hypothetical protein
MMFQLRVVVRCLDSLLHLTTVQVDSLLRLTVRCLNYVLYLTE